MSLCPQHFAVVERPTITFVSMKPLATFLAGVFLFGAVGCTLGYRQSDNNDGFDFPSGKINKIIKGKTTADEIIRMFGGPLSKSSVSETEEIWNYSSSDGTEIIESGFLTDEVIKTGHRKTLVIRLKNGTVSTFTFTESSY
jgi:hypothetical protein